MVNLNVLLLIFNRREQTGFVNYVTLTIFANLLREIYLCEIGNLCIFVRNETEKALMRLDNLLFFFWVCSEPQQVFRYMVYLKFFFYYHILKYYSYKTNKIKCNGSLLIKKRWFKKFVKQHTSSWYFAEKYIILPKKVISVRHVNYVTDLFAHCSLHKNTIHNFQYQKRI